ncbi:transglutaminase domain-containing protein [Phaeovulum sp.]|uniref:transglutaminase family protein n=1 Tax=Phaeovulum sp. TaxID=2934796 RepID=UPI0035678447
MILTVRHATRYLYSAPMRGAVQSLRLFPSRFEGQSVRHWHVEVEGGIRGASFVDGAGDRIEGWSVRGPLNEVCVRVEGEVETHDLSGVLRGHREAVPAAAYLRPTPATQPDAALTALAEAAVADAKEPLARAHCLSLAVTEAIAYRPGATHAHTTAAESLGLGEGVCQDHAHALIAVANITGMPARYVSGYLFSDAQGVAHEAAHAWAEIWLDGLGWVGFDAANACCPDDRYIRLGSGRNAQEAAPIRGLALGQGSAEKLEVEVAVGAAQQ